MDREELLRRYAAGERDFSGIKSWDSHSDGIDLSGADLSGNMMDEVYFARSILKGVSFRNAELAQSCLNAADLTDADLRGANLIYTTFSSANLTNADLRRAKFHETSFDRANLTGANLSGANLARCIFWEANLTGANLEGASLRKASFRNTIMPDGSIRTDASNT